MQISLNTKELNIFIEGRRTKTFVGILEYNKERKKFVFNYDKKYLKSENSIPLGPDIPLTKIRHEAEGKLFPSFKDRIPSSRNPAYEDYCKQEGISTKEKNPIVLLGTIGKRGPSSFVFEKIFNDEYNIQHELEKFRIETGLSLTDISNAFDLNYVTVQRLLTNKSKDANTTKLIRIFLEYPDCLLDQLIFSKDKLHQKAVTILLNYAQKKQVEREEKEIGG